MTTTQQENTKGEIGSYDSIEAAAEAVRKLGEAGFPVEHVSIITKNLQSETEVHGFYTAKDIAKQEARFGAWMGGLFGILGGAALLIVPGVGPVIAAGSVASMLVGGVEGAATFAAAGGLIGAATGHFIARKHIPKLVEHFDAGKYLIVAQSDSDDELAQAKEILAENHIPLD